MEKNAIITQKAEIIKAIDACFTVFSRYVETAEQAKAYKKQAEQQLFEAVKSAAIQALQGDAEAWQHFADKIDRLDDYTKKKILFMASSDESVKLKDFIRADKGYAFKPSRVNNTVAIAQAESFTNPFVEKTVKVLTADGKVKEIPESQAVKPIKTQRSAEEIVNEKLQQIIKMIENGKYTAPTPSFKDLLEMGIKANNEKIAKNAKLGANPEPLRKIGE